MSVEGPNRKGLFRFDRLVRGNRLKSFWIYSGRREAAAAESRAIARFMETGEMPTAGIPVTGGESSETVSGLYSRWIRWLENHRSPRHAYNMRSLMSRALGQCPDMADLPVEALTVDAVEEWGEIWAADLLERGLSRKTVNDWLRYSQTAFSPPWGRRRAPREILNNPFQYVDRYSVERRAKYVPTPQEIASLRMAADGEFRVYLEIMVETGARVGEGLSLAWADLGVDTPPFTVVLYTSKTATGNRQPRRLEISAELAARLRSRRKQAGAGTVYLFQQADQEKPHHQVWVRKQLRAACRLAGVDVFPPGSLRHFYASRLAYEGVPLTTIQARLGHSKATTTDNYLRELRGV